MIDADRIRGALLGTAVGDALGMPVEGLSHQSIRTFYAGIKGYASDDRRRDLQAGQWTDDTQFTFAFVRVLTETPVLPEATDRLAKEYLALEPVARRWGPTSSASIERLARGEQAVESPEATNGAAMRVAPLGVWWAATGASLEEAVTLFRPLLALTHRHPTALAAGIGQAFAVKYVLTTAPGEIDRDAFWGALVEATARIEVLLDPDGEWPLSRKLERLEAHLRDFPLDLHDACGGAGVRADESWPFAVAMFARNPTLLEATLLSTINAGGDADTTGAMVGALLGALHGWSAFPETWRTGLEEVETLTEQSNAFVWRLLG